MRFSLLFPFLSVLLVVAVSCNTQKKVAQLVYFNEQGDSTLSRIVQNTEPLIQAGDRLSIVVTALDPGSVAPYNPVSSAAPAAGSAANTSGYIVENDGMIQFPQLGKLHVAGMQRKQLVDTITRKLTRYVTDPLVTVSFVNFKITVLGEVGRQGTYNIPDGKVTLIEALGLAGDLTMTARRDNIMVIREKSGVREFGKVNLLSKSSFSSPYFVLHQNDVVYVEPTKAKVAANDQSLVRSITITTSVISVLSALVVLVVNITR